MAVCAAVSNHWFNFILEKWIKDTKTFEELYSMAFISVKLSYVMLWTKLNDEAHSQTTAIGMITKAVKREIEVK